MTDEKKKAPYHWFEGKSVVELVDRIVHAGIATARLEVHQAGEKMTFVVKSQVQTLDGDDPPPINDSHRCPPQCP